MSITRILKAHLLSSHAFSITKGGFSLGIFYSLVRTHHLLNLRPEECVLLGTILLAGVKLYDLFIDSSHDPFLLPQQTLWKVISRRLSETTKSIPDGQSAAEQLGTCGGQKIKQERITGDEGEEAGDKCKTD